MLPFCVNSVPRISYVTKVYDTLACVWGGGVQKTQCQD